MSLARNGSRASGFTLVEVLLALAIFGMMSVLAYRAMVALTDGEAQLSREAQRWRTLEALFTRFESDIRQAIPRGSLIGSLASSNDAAKIEPAWLAVPADSAGNAALVFTRAGTEFSGEPGIAGQRMGYRLRGHALEIAYWPGLDNAADVHPAVYTLVDGVTSLRILYLNRSGAWRDRWPLQGESDLPRAVRVELTLDSGEVIERWFTLR
jgi:general secretion pathway protein J